MQNWTALLGLEQGVRVRHTSKSWIVHVSVIRGKNAAEIYGLAMNLSNRIAVALAKKYGVVLAEGVFVGGVSGLLRIRTILGHGLVIFFCSCLNGVSVLLDSNVSPV